MKIFQRVFVAVSAIGMFAACKSTNSSVLDNSGAVVAQQTSWMDTIQRGHRDPFGGIVTTAATEPNGSRKIVSSYLGARVLSLGAENIKIRRGDYQTLEIKLRNAGYNNQGLDAKLAGLQAGSLIDARVMHILENPSKSFNFLLDLGAVVLQPIDYKEISHFPEGSSAMKGDGTIMSVQRQGTAVTTTMLLAGATLISKSGHTVDVQSDSGRFTHRFELSSNANADVLVPGDAVDLTVRFIYRPDVLPPMVPQGNRVLSISRAKPMPVAGQSGRVVNVDGAKGDRLLNAIRAAGIQFMQNPNGVGAKYLAVREISCQIAVAPNANSTCLIRQVSSQPGAQGTAYPVFGDIAKELQAALRDAGARYSEGTVGVNRDHAQDIECFLVVAPNTKGQCAMKVQGL